MTYKISSSSCCKGKITPGLSQLVADCCESVAYNPLNKICCNGRIQTRNSAQAMCCGTEVYLKETDLCCVDTIYKLEQNLFCCGNKSYSNESHCCCTSLCSDPNVKPKSEPCCSKLQTDGQSTVNSCTEKETARRSPPQLPSNFTSPYNKVSELMCGSKAYNPQKKVCCSGNLFKKSSVITKCCGEHVYSVSEKNVMCCNGNLHRDLPEQSECVGGVVYTPGRTVCKLFVRPRLGEHCCGEKTFNLNEHICCNGHRHSRLNGNFCCGSEAYDPYNQFQMRCCSGHLYNITHLGGKAECCGTLLLEDNTNQTCCSSTSHDMIYEIQPKHLCCGHDYYNTSLWSCCAGHLKPTPKTNISLTEHRLKPLMELIPDICNKSVLFGKVESVALDNYRNIVLRVIARMHVKSAGDIKNPLVNVTLDHCNSPALELGMTYLWEMNSSVYKPLSHPIDQPSDIHMLFIMLQLYEGCKQK
ncbi:galaxin isoform X2 [Xyrauchen texanus]|nr:galaxin isoform X2 [Xyrauchen texanus]XP_052008636.1 galaxin isoform X2 [Xyrauchen texanus]XP_052008637.1 galaxin isoform X2 [Xyrauchen texanus]XP_052008638.1 galaxin isoform X2 [Xyrauchen texanus]